MHATTQDAGFRLTAYPALLLFAGVGFGAWVEYAIGARNSTIWLLFSLLTCVVAFSASRSTPAQLVSLVRLSRYVTAASLAIGAGGMRMAQFDSPTAKDVAHVLEVNAELEVVIHGRTVETPAVSNGRARFFLHVDSLRPATGDIGLPVSGTVYVSIRSAEPGAWLEDARTGSRIVVAGRLHPPYPPRNPADFDFRRYLRHRGVRAMLRVEESAHIAAVAPPAAFVQRLAIRVERRIERAIGTHLPTPLGRDVLGALLLGRRNQIDQEVLDQFARTGLMHVLAVSGLHVVMVGMVVYGLLCPLLLRVRLRWRMMELVRASTTLVLLSLYAIVTGGSASVVRAVVMAGVLIGGVTLQRSAASINSLAVAGCILLLQRPTYLWDVGFQLSFAAVGAIILLNRPLTQLFGVREGGSAVREHLVQGTSTTVAATLGTAPVLLYHFGSVSAAGLFLNPIAIPATGLALSSGLLTVATADVVPLANAFGQSADLFAHGLVQTASLGDRIFDWARLELRVAHLPHLIAMIMFAALLATVHRRALRWRLLLITLIVLTVSSWYDAGWGRAKPTLEVLFLDVGQGDATLVRFPNGRVMLVDLGPRDRFADAGARVVVPHLQWLNIRHVDAVLISHPHADHLGGLPALLRAIPVRRLIDNGEVYASELFDEVAMLRDSLSLTYTPTSAGDTLLLDPRVRVYVLAPTDRTKSDPDPNERSIVVLMQYGATSILLTGDAEDAAEREVMRHYSDGLSADVIKVAHHGSQTSSSIPFVRRVAGGGDLQWAVVSVGRINRFGLPDEVVIKRWEASGASVHLTADEGALWLTSDGEHVERVHWRKD